MDLATLKEQAERCRRLAKHADPFTQKRLLDLAAEYEARMAQTRVEAFRGVTQFAERRDVAATAYLANANPSTIVSGVCLNSFATTSRTVPASSSSGLPT